MEIINNTHNVPCPKLDKFLWALILALVAAGAFANYYFSELAWALRFTGWIILICVLIGLAAATLQGKRTWDFAKNARIELLKVVWPTREETAKITMVVAALVLVASIILWGIDSVLLRIVAWLTGTLT
ncbi:MAG: preprotein translocase subunit SecE [bacterium]